MASKRSKHEDDGGSSDSESESGEMKPQPVSKKRPLETELFPKEKEKETKKANANGGLQSPCKSAETPKLTPAPSASHEDDGGSSDSDSGSESEEMKPQPVSKSSKKAKLSTEEEEIAFLKAIIDYEEKTGQNPSQDMEAFHAFVNKSLSTDASKSQVYEKLRRLKNKYLNNVDKLNKEGASSLSLKPHPKRVFDLSNKIWPNGGSASKPETPKPLTPETEPQKETSLATFVCLAVSKSCDHMESYVIEQGLKSKLLNGAQRAEFEERFAKLKTELLEHLVERNELVHQNSKTFLQARK